MPETQRPTNEPTAVATARSKATVLNTKREQAKLQDAFAKTARTWSKVRETMQALINAKGNHEKQLKVQLAFLDQARAAHKAWAMVVSEQCTA